MFFTSIYFSLQTRDTESHHPFCRASFHRAAADSSTLHLKSATLSFVRVLQSCHHQASQRSKIGWVGREKKLSCSKTGKGREQRNTFSSPAMTLFPAVPFRKTLAAGSGALSLARAPSTYSRWRGLAQDSTLNPAVVSRETNHPFLVNL